jgi:hypothetical protein
MFHFEMFSSSIAQNGLNQVTANYNGVVVKLNNGFQIPVSLNYLHSIFAVSTHLERVRMQTPAFLPFPYPDYNPNNRGSAFESPPRIWDFSMNPPAMNPTDELDAFAYQNNSAAETVYVGINFTDNAKIPVPAGRVLSVHWTSSTTLTAGAFTLIQPVLDQALPAGTYAMVGSRVFSATGLFFQMQPAMGQVWRPGGICVQAYDQLDPVNQRANGYVVYPNMSWGVWLTFLQNVPPQVNIFATSADTAEEGWYDLVKIA